MRTWATASVRRTQHLCRSRRTDLRVAAPQSRSHALKAELVSTARRTKATSEVELATKCRPFELAEYPILPIHHLHAATGSDRPAEPTVPHGIVPNSEAAHLLILDAQTTACVQRHRSAGIGAAEIAGSDRR